MAMSKKDFEAFASMIKLRVELSTTVEEKSLLIGLAQDIANYFCKDNKRFDYKRFYKACGLSEHLFGPNLLALFRF